jgi:hypothetical protein
MPLVGTTKGGVGVLGSFAAGERAVGRDGAALAVDPLGLDRVEPGSLNRQAAGDDADAPTDPFDAPVVGAQPRAYRAADMPRGVAPHEAAPPCRAASVSPHQTRNWLVSALAGRPSTKRSSTSLSVARAFGPRSSAAAARATRGGGRSFSTVACSWCRRLQEAMR